MTDGSDEPLGLIALAACGWFTWREPRRDVSSRRLFTAAAGLVFLTLLPPGTPALVLALIWIGSVAMLSARTAAWAALLAYSLPVMASAQFFAGYPVRVAVTWAAAGLLRSVGLAVSPSATLLVWHQDRVLIDAPCSGLQMAWFAGLIALIAANAYKLDVKRSARLLAASAAITFVANVVRAATLFVLETQLRVSAEWMHDGVGLLLFAGVVAAVLARAAIEHQKERAAPRLGVGTFLSGQPARERCSPLWFGSARVARMFWRGPESLRSQRQCGRTTLVSAFILFAGLAAARPFSESSFRVSGSALQVAFPGWQRAPLGVAVDDLRAVPLDAKTERFAADFPGKLAVFSNGSRTWIARWVLRPTRKLHSSSDCLRAAGYHVVPGRARVDRDGALWSSFCAKRDGEELRVCERITASNGAAWTDVSAWFWDAFFDADSGPWWAITDIQPAPDGG